MKLYGIPPTRALRPLWLLNELDLDCEVVMVDLPGGEHREPDFLALNPFGKVPVLVDGGLAVTESAAIPFYLAGAQGGGRFLPTAVPERAAMYQLSFFLVAEIEQPLWRIALHSAIYPEAERRPDEIPLAARDCRRMLEPLERHIADRATLVGSDLTVTDFIAAYTLDWAGEAGLLDGSPNLAAFVERMYARPAAPPRIAEAFAVLRAGGIPSRWRHREPIPA